MEIFAQAFTMVPTNDLAGSVAAYVAGGLEILWRPDPYTTLVGANERACVMVEDDATELALGAGPVLLGRVSHFRSQAMTAQRTTPAR